MDNMYQSDPEDPEEKKNRKKSLISDYVSSGKCVFISFDMETGGDHCGILQLSAECFILDTDINKSGGVKLSKVFNSYVKPPEDATWSLHDTKIHGLHKHHPSIHPKCR